MNSFAFVRLRRIEALRPLRDLRVDRRSSPVSACVNHDESLTSADSEQHPEVPKLRDRTGSRNQGLPDDSHREAPRLLTMSRVSGKAYCVYVLWSQTARRFYIGIRDDPARRLAQPNAGTSKGARNPPFHLDKQPKNFGGEDFSSPPSGWQVSLPAGFSTLSSLQLRTQGGSRSERTADADMRRLHRSPSGSPRSVPAPGPGH